MKSQREQDEETKVEAFWKVGMCVHMHACMRACPCVCVCMVSIAANLIV